MSISINPTVGSIVYFYPQGKDAKYFSHEKGEPLAAIIVKANSSSSVNLVVFNQYGSPVCGIDPVSLIQAGELPPTDVHYCTWMPFQIGQAKKYDGK